MVEFAWTEKKKRLVRIIGVTGAVYLSFRFLLPPFAPFLLAGLVGVWLHPAVAWLEKRLRVPKGVGAFVLVGGLLALVLGGGICLGGKLEQQARLLLERFWQMPTSNIWQRFAPILENAGGRLREWSVDLALEQAGVALKTMGNVGAWIAVFVIGAIMVARDWPTLRALFLKSIYKDEWLRIGGRLSEVGKAYVRSESACFAAVFFVSAIGLWILGSSYVLLFALGIATVDLLPIFGSGTVYVPWIILNLLQGEYLKSIVLGGAYVLCYVLRNTIEARKMGDRLGFHPLITLSAAYVGWKLFGLAGFLLGPIGLVIIAEFK